jgi:type II secretory pathway pseudopilin PulG
LALAYQDTRSQFQAFYPWIQLGAQVAVKQLQKEGVEADVAALPSIAAIAPHLLPSVSSVQRTSDGWTCESRGTLPGMNVGASAPVLVALLLPAVQSAREAARRSQSMNNMKQIGLAMHNYHDTFRGFPPSANVDQDGKPLLSWRVHILPYLEQQALYQKFHLDEPWDSEHNRQLIELMPQLYRSPNSVAGAGKTVYLGNAGSGGIFVPPATNRGKQIVGLSMARITDGTSNTIMLVEASDDMAVTWTKPDDYSFNSDQPLKGLTTMRPGGFLAGFCDGSVRFIGATIDVSVLKALFTANGGEATDLNY